MHRTMIAAFSALCLLAGWMAGSGLGEVETQGYSTTVGRYRMITERGMWLLATATGDTWTYRCSPGAEGECSAYTGLTKCLESYEWVRKQRN